MLRVGDAAGSDFEVEVDRDGDAAHVGDLHVEDHEVGARSSATAARTSWPRVTSSTVVSDDGQRGAHLVADPLAIGGDEDRGHRRRGYCANEVAAHLAQGGDVVHVVGHERDVRDRRSPMCCGDAGEQRALAVGRARRGRRGCRSGRRGGAPRRRRRGRALVAGGASRRATARGRSCVDVGGGCERGVHPVRDERARSRSSLLVESGRRSRSPRRSSRAAADVTSTKLVDGLGEQRAHRVGAARKPSSMPSKARKKEMMSSITAVPITRPTWRTNACRAALATPEAAPRAGTIRMRNTRLSSSRISRCGASRKSSAWRVGGVSTTMRS